MIGDLRLIRLQQLLKKLTHTQNALRVARDRVQVAEVLTEHSSEYEIAVFFLLRDEADGCEIGSKTLYRNDSTGWVGSYDLVRAAHADDWRVWLGLHQVEYLPISEEEKHTLLNHVLEDEILVVVTLNHDV